MSCDVGAITVDHRTNDLTWSLPRLPRDKSPELAGTVYVAPGGPQPLESIYATLAYNLPGECAAVQLAVWGVWWWGRWPRHWRRHLLHPPAGPPATTLTTPSAAPPLPRPPPFPPPLPPPALQASPSRGWACATCCW
jgi:hypothetical protein